MSHSVVPEAATATRIRFFETFIWASRRPMSSMSSVAIDPLACHLVGDIHLLEQRYGLVDSHFRGEAARGQFHQQGQAPSA